jgi:hypothetical protein
MAQLALPLMIASTGIKAVGQFASGIQNRNALRAQAREEDRATNAEISARREAARKAIGEQLAAGFGGGFEGNTGSALDALTESQVNAALDALEIRRQGNARARSLRAEGNMRMREGAFSAVGTLLGGASGVVDMKTDWANARAGQGNL